MLLCWYRYIIVIVISIIDITVVILVLLQCASSSTRLGPDKTSQKQFVLRMQLICQLCQVCLWHAAHVGEIRSECNSHLL